MPSARRWHWIDFHTVQKAGLCWKPKRPPKKKFLNGGYVSITRKWMTAEDITLAEKHDLFRGARKSFLKEHQLVAVKKYGSIPVGHVVRHINGIRTDNRPENLVLGTSQENTADHNTARLMAMVWRERAEALGWPTAEVPTTLLPEAAS